MIFLALVSSMKSPARIKGETTAVAALAPRRRGGIGDVCSTASGLTDIGTSTFNSNGSTPCGSQPSDDCISKRGAENVDSPFAKRQKTDPPQDMDLNPSCHEKAAVDKGRQVPRRKECSSCGLELEANEKGTSHQKCLSVLAYCGLRQPLPCITFHIL